MYLTCVLIAGLVLAGLTTNETKPRMDKRGGRAWDDKSYVFISDAHITEDEMVRNRSAWKRVSNGFLVRLYNTSKRARHLFKKLDKNDRKQEARLALEAELCSAEKRRKDGDHMDFGKEYSYNCLRCGATDGKYKLNELENLCHTCFRPLTALDYGYEDWSSHETYAIHESLETSRENAEYA